MMNILKISTLNDFYLELGSSFYCSEDTTGSIKKYHTQIYKAWVQVIRDWREECLKIWPEKPPLATIRKILFTHLKDEILNSLEHVTQLHFVDDEKKVEKELNLSINKWIEVDLQLEREIDNYIKPRWIELCSK